MRVNLTMDDVVNFQKPESRLWLFKGSLIWIAYFVVMAFAYGLTPAQAHPSENKHALSADREQPRKLVIFHTSDMHGYVIPHKARWHTSNPKRLIGGFEALAATVNATKQPYLLLDSGDFFQGAPEGTLSRGHSVIELMNVLKYDAAVIGNHEYDFGEENLIALSKRAKFPLLAANIQSLKTGAPVSYARPWALFERGGIKVGVIGLSTRFTSTATLPAHVAHLRFVTEVEAAKPHVLALRHAGADVVIALTHCGVGPSVARKHILTSDYKPPVSDLKYPGDILIAKESGVDLVLGGHAHAAFSELWTPQGGVPIAQSGEHLEHVTRIEIQVHKGKPLTISGSLIPLWSDQRGSHAEMARAVERVSADVQKQMKKPLGRAQDPLPRTAPSPNLDGPLPNLFCDEMKRQGGSDFALHNTFGFRTDLNKGPLTVGDLYRVMPFENTLAVMNLTGAQVRDLILSNVKGGVSRIQVSRELTVRVSLDPELNLTHGQVHYKGSPINPNQKFKVAMNSYMSGGGSCCRDLKDLPHTDTAIPLRVLFMDTIKSKSPVKAPSVGRIKSVSHQ